MTGLLQRSRLKSIVFIPIFIYLYLYLFILFNIYIYIYYKLFNIRTRLIIYG